MFGDKELEVDGAKWIWNNNSQTFSIAGSPSMSESVDYIWAPVDGDSGQVLSTNGAGVLSFQDVNAIAGIHELLSITHTDAIGASITAGDLIFGNATPKWNALGIGASNEILRVSGGFPDWEATTFITELGDITAQSITISGLSGNKNIVFGTEGKELASVTNLAVWIGGSNNISVDNDGDGTVTVNGSLLVPYNNADADLNMGLNDITFGALKGISFTNNQSQIFTLKSTSAGNLFFGGTASMSLSPETDSSQSLGEPSFHWNAGFINNLHSNSLTAPSGTFTIGDLTVSGEMGITGDAAAGGAGADAVDVLILTGGEGGSHSGGGNTGGVGSDIIFTCGDGGIGTGGADGGDGGALIFTSGDGGAGATPGTGGDIDFLTGGSAATSGSGKIGIKTGIALALTPSGKITVETGTSGATQNSGDIEIFSGTGGAAAVSGDIKIRPGASGAGGTQGEITLGDGTNQTIVSATGDLSFEGTAGLIYGHMHIPAAAVITVETSGTANPVEVKDDGTTSANDGWASSYQNGVTFAASDLHYQTVTIAGTYEVIWSMSPATNSGGGTVIHGGICIDTTTFQRDNGEGHAHVFNNNDDIHISSVGIVDCPNGNEEISLWISNDAAQKTLIEHGNMSVKLIGGT